MLTTSLYPRGNVLTEAMPFTSRDGTPWLAYIEGVAETRDYPRHAVTLPGRRLRFDSATESRITSEHPPGSPFLPEARLQALLDHASPVPPPSTATWRPPGVPFDWARRWRAGAERRRAIRERIGRLLSETFDAALAVVGRLAFGRADEGTPSRGQSPAARRRRGPRWASRPRSK